MNNRELSIHNFLHMSGLTQVVGALGILTMLAGPLAAQEQNPLCATQDDIARQAIRILNEGCGENDEKEGTIGCNISELKIIQFLQSCGEKANPYLEAIYQQMAQKN